MLVVRVETDLKKVPKSLWIKDCKSNICNVCLNKITGGWVKSGKHHCRYCGHIVCGTCSGHAVFESKSTYHRICDRCFNQTTRSKTKKSTKGKKGESSKKLNSRSRHLSTPITTPRSPVLRPLSTPNIVDDEDRRLCPLSPPNNKTGSVQDKKRKLTITYHQSSHPEWSESDILTKPYWENRRDLLVGGYLRGQYAQKEIPWLPQDIINTLIEWSFINDVWRKYGNHSDDHISISNYALSLCRVSKSNEHCYYGFGRDVVTTDHVKTWNVRLDKVDYYTNNYCSMIIGVAEVGKVNWIKSLLGDFTYGCYRGYGLRVAERCRFVHQHSNQPIFISKGSLKKGDIIRVTLDLTVNAENGDEQGQNSKYGSLGFAFEDGYGNNIRYGMNEEFGWMGRRKQIAFDKVRRDRSYVLVVGMYCQNKITFVEECNT